MIAAALALLAAAALPEGTARWRMELAGEPAGVVELSIRCDGPACLAAWTSRQRLPEEAGGAIRARRVEVPVDAEGRAQGPARLDEEGRRREVALPRGATPAMLVEVALAARRRAGEPSPCLDAVEESTGEPFRACARPGSTGRFSVEGRGEREEVTLGAGPFPARVALAAQGVAFVLDARAELARAPRLYGVVVAGPDDPRDAASFCGAAPDPEPPAAAVPGLPPPRAPGRSCQERTAGWLAAARRAGLRGRTAVGVAHDGAAFVWHAWAEVLAGGRWVPIDPSFRQAPAAGPRFTLATFEDGDEAARAAAGRRILACWGRARVEAGSR